MELWSGWKQIRTLRKELTYVIKGKLGRDIEGSIADYFNEAKKRAKSSSPALSNDEGSSSHCNWLRGEMQSKNRHNLGCVQL